jgi:3-methyl-2-oxobutanoate hydroxymethyltransferase
MAEERKRLTVPDLKARKKANEKVVMVSIPDYPSAVWAERAGIDIAAVGDSLGMTNYGHPNTLPVTVDMMIQHCQAVRRGAPNCMVLVAMPYGSYATEEIGVLNALRIMKEGGAAEVRSGKFPDADHSYSMKPEEADKLKSLMAKRTKN